MWRLSLPADDELVVSMCVALNAEDPGPQPVPKSHIRRTLQILRLFPDRGQVVVLEIGDHVRGYALLISYWSNELGGEVCVIDELYVVPEIRGRGHGTTLLAGLATRTLPWSARAAALTLEVSPNNARARHFYERLGFQRGNLTMIRPLRNP